MKVVHGLGGFDTERRFCLNRLGILVVSSFGARIFAFGTGVRQRSPASMRVVDQFMFIGGTSNPSQYAMVDQISGPAATPNAMITSTARIISTVRHAFRNLSEIGDRWFSPLMPSF